MKYINIKDDIMLFHNSSQQINDHQVVNYISLVTRQVGLCTAILQKDAKYIKDLIEVKNSIYARYAKMYGFNKE